MVVASIAAIAADQNPASGDPAYGGTYVEGVAGVPQYLNPVIAATDVDEDVSRLVFSGLTRYDQTGAIVPTWHRRSTPRATGGSGPSKSVRTPRGTTGNRSP